MNALVAKIMEVLAISEGGEDLGCARDAVGEGWRYAMLGCPAQDACETVGEGPTGDDAVFVLLRAVVRTEGRIGLPWSMRLLGSGLTARALVHVHAVHTKGSCRLCHRSTSPGSLHTREELLRAWCTVRKALTSHFSCCVQRRGLRLC
jgi:hypothetical protein